jgi:hypothetical protein
MTEQTKKPTPRKKAAAAKPVLTTESSSPQLDEAALLAQFAVGLLRDGTGRIGATDVALRQRVQDAFARARVMLDEFKLQLGA